MEKAKASKSVKEIPVELGFVEERTETWKLTSPYFPSKIGGKPAWLNLKDLPNPEVLKCSSCHEPTQFLLQIYAPLGAVATAHRSIFLFICTSKACYRDSTNTNKNIVAYRTQLEYVNDFYAPNPKDFDIELAKFGPQNFGVKLCRLCGVMSNNHCGACEKVNYCSKVHQKQDWSYRHSTECKKQDFKPEPPTAPSILTFNECEIVIDKEIIPKSSSKHQSDSEKLKEYEQLLAEGKAGSLGSDGSSSTKEMLEAASYKSDKVFNKFRKRVAYEPQQIIRYDRGGEPLWVSSEQILLSNDIPPCCLCKSPRIFEFQIMPQLLNHLGQEAIEGALDWGTIVVYTCGNDCKTSGEVEFTWQQDFKGNDKDEK